MKKIQIGERILLLSQLVEITPLTSGSVFSLIFSNNEEIKIQYKASQQRSDLVMFLDNNSLKLKIYTI